MIITPQGITADVTEFGVFQRAGKGCIGGKVVHANANDPERSGLQFVRASAHHSVPRHPFHLAVVLFFQPCLQFGLVGAEIGIGDTDLLKAQFSAPQFDLLR